MARTLVLDLDGTILDTESAVYGGWQEVYRRRGAVLPLEVWLQCVGSSADSFDPHGYLECQLGERLDRQAIRAEANRVAEEVLDHLLPLPGVVELVQAARQAGLRVGVASSSPRSWVTHFLRQVGQGAEMEAVGTADDVEQVKPAPDLYLSALEALDVTGPEALALEDSAHGARAALLAGMRCVVVPNDLTRRASFPPGVARVASLAGWTPEALWSLAGEVSEWAG